MKLFLIVATLAFVAVQLSHSAPTPDEDKKAEPEVAPVSPAAAEATAQPLAEDKAAAPEAPASPSESAPAEEKKA